jgi:4-amino-4-deoxy-L-arabinose transferase-like glycosyltransferase
VETQKRFRRIDAAWLIGLCLFVFAGMPLATFHGDETYYTYVARDFYTAFVEGRPDLLYTEHIWGSHANYQRVVNGSVPPHLIGLTMWLAGYQRHQLAEHGSFYFGLTYDDNYNMGVIPPNPTLWTARISSCVMLCLGGAAMFLIGRMVGGRSLAYVLSALFIINPVILLNGRRAMLEGALLGFGLLTIYVGFAIARRREQGERVGAGWWIALTALAAAASASKQIGYAYTGIAFGTIALGELLRLRFDAARSRPRLNALLSTYARLAVCTAAAVILYYIMSPGLWYHDPLLRFQQMVSARQQMMDIHISFTPNAPASLAHRIDNILTQPFIRPMQHFETKGFAESPTFMRMVARYEASPLSGVHFGVVGGSILLALTIMGVLLNLRAAARGHRSSALALGWYFWLFGMIGVMLLNPLPWQRYYLALIPPFSAFAGLALVRMFQAANAPVPQALQPSSASAD